MHTVPLGETKDRLSDLVDQVQATREAVTITRLGRPAVVMMTVDDLESLEETLFWLSQPGIREDLAEARREIAEGRTVTMQQGRGRHRRFGAALQDAPENGEDHEVSDEDDDADLSVRPSAAGKTVLVTRAQVRAAKGRIDADQRLRRETPEWIRRVAAAKPRTTH